MMSPSHALQGFFHNAQHICQPDGWQIEYFRQAQSILFTKGEEQIVGTVEDGQVHLRSALELRRTRAKAWLKGFPERLLDIASSSRCVVSSAGYPKVDFHCHQLLSTTDHEEIRYHLEALVETKARVHGQHKEMCGG